MIIFLIKLEITVDINLQLSRFTTPHPTPVASLTFMSGNHEITRTCKSKEFLTFKIN